MVDQLDDSVPMSAIDVTERSMPLAMSMEVARMLLVSRIIVSPLGKLWAEPAELVSQKLKTVTQLLYQDAVVPAMHIS